MKLDIKEKNITKAFDNNNDHLLNYDRYNLIKVPKETIKQIKKDIKKKEDLNIKYEEEKKSKEYRYYKAYCFISC